MKQAKLRIAVALACLFFGLLSARAAQPVHCTVLAIEASNSNRGIDPKLQAYTAIFKEPPFSAFNSFELVRSETLTMPAEQPVKLKLPNSLGGSLQLKKREGTHLDLLLTLARRDQTPIEIKGRAKPGAPFFAAGMRSKRGVWIFGVVCTRDEIQNH